jgi:hypothetical protein
VSRDIRMARPQRLRVGTRVRYRFPAAVLEAEVIEDRGFALSNDEQVVRIRATEETDFPAEFDVPVHLLEVLDPPATNGRGSSKRPSPG